MVYLSNKKFALSHRVWSNVIFFPR
jgi:hypothetical protein